MKLKIVLKAHVGKLGDDQVSLLVKKSLNYENCVNKGANHLNERLNDLEISFNRSNRPDSSTTALGAADKARLETLLRADFKERLKLWYDLSKIARKQQIWDICRVSCRFCTLYDNPKHIDRFLRATTTTISQQPQQQQQQQASSNLPGLASLFDQELMRNLAEVHFVFGEVI